jgi:hypothetical protein
VLESHTDFCFFKKKTPLQKSLVTQPRRGLREPCAPYYLAERFRLRPHSGKRECGGDGTVRPPRAPQTVGSSARRKALWDGGLAFLPTLRLGGFAGVSCMAGDPRRGLFHHGHPRQENATARGLAMRPGNCCECGGQRPKPGLAPRGGLWPVMPSREMGDEVDLLLLMVRDP